METIELCKVVDLAALYAEDDETTGLLAAGPWTHQPASRPHRIVLADRGDQFVVWDELLQGDELGEKCDRKSFFANGDYFQPHELDRAVKRFGERVARSAVHVSSVYRKVSQPVS